MTALLRAELLKLWTVRSTWGYAAAVVGLAGLVSAGSIGSESELGRLAKDFQYDLLLNGTAPAVLIGLLLGCIVVTNEFRHGTITPTLLVLPRRGALLALKLAAAALGAGALALMAILVIVAVAAVWLTALDVALETGEIARGVGYAVLGAVVAGAFGAGVGGVIQSQVAALVGIFVYVFVAEPILWAVLGALGLDASVDYLPTQTALGVTDSGGDGLALWPRLAVALGWTGLAVGLAWLRLRRRDIT